MYRDLYLTQVLLFKWSAIAMLTLATGERLTATD